MRRPVWRSSESSPLSYRGEVSPPLKAAEVAEGEWAALRNRIADEIEEWESLGLRPALGFREPEGRPLVTWRHERHADLTGRSMVDAGFIKTLGTVRPATPKLMLALGALFLHSAGCAPIYVTDPPHDAGIGIVGRVKSGHWRSTITFIQCKTLLNDRCFQSYYSSGIR
jgi:hypothetical protein